MAALLNRARMTTATTGTGTVTLGSAVTGYASFAEAGAVNATVYSYCIEDGDDFEIGVGTYTSSGTTFSRDTVTISKVSGTAGTDKLDLSGSAEIFITLRSGDLGDSAGLDVGTTAGTVAAGDDSRITGALQSDGSNAMTGALTVAEISTPSTPASGSVSLYPKSDGKWYALDGAGTETQVGSADPASDDGDSLGTTSLKWSDLFLASGGVINWNSGNVTLTHSSAALTMGGSGGLQTLLISGPAGSAGHSLPQLVLRCNDTVTPDGAGGFIRFQGPNSAGTMKSAVQVNAGFVDATDGAEDATWAVNVMRDGDATNPAFGCNAVYEALIPGTDDFWDLGAESPDDRRWRDLYLTRTAYILNDDGAAELRMIGGTSALFTLQDLNSTSGKQAGRFRLDAAQLVIDSLNDSLGGAVVHTRFYLGGGLGIGSPTGGDKGAGTINAAGDIYKNNTAYTNPDYVFESFYTGKIEKYAESEGADEYSGMMALDDLREYTKSNLRLPGIDDEPMGAFKRSDKALEKIEELTLYILELHERLRELESRGC